MTNYRIGLEGMGLGFVDPTSGAFLGQSTTLTNGTASPAFVQDNIVSAAVTQVAQEDLNVRGGDRVKVTARFGNPKLSPFDVQVTDMTATLIAALENTTINTTNSKYKKYGVNSNRVSSGAWACWFWHRFPGDDGSNKYHMTIIPKCEMRFREAESAYRGEQTHILSVNPLIVSKSMTQQLFGSGANNLNFGFEQDKGDHYFVESDYPFHWMAFRRLDALALTLATTYRPLNSVVTLNATENEMTVLGVPTALTSINTTSGQFIVPAGGAAGDIGHLQYTTQFVPV